MISEFAKEKVFWTRKMNLKLVHFIKNKPNIWNPKHSKYTSVRHRDQTYSEFAVHYGNKFTGQAVKDRWTNIRSTFANYLRKLNASRAKGEEYKINWHLWEPCQFLMKVNRSSKDITLELNDGDENEDITTMMLDGADDTEDENASENTFTIDGSFNSCKAFAENLFNIFKSMQNDAFGLDNTKYGKLGRIITKKLSQMDSYEATKATQKIIDILLLYDEHNLKNPNNVKSEITF